MRRRTNVAKRLFRIIWVKLIPDCTYCGTRNENLTSMVLPMTKLHSYPTSHSSSHRQLLAGELMQSNLRFCFLLETIFRLFYLNLFNKSFICCDMFILANIKKGMKCVLNFKNYRLFSYFLIKHLKSLSTG
jgi:hypothetical protein